MDNAATSLPKPDVVTESASRIFQKCFANPGRSGHRMSVDAARHIFAVRDRLAYFLGAGDPDRIIFFANATLALNAAINGILEPGDHVITSAMEHNSVMRPLRAHQAKGIELSVVGCMSDGALYPESVRREIRSNTKAIVVTHVSNVTGTVMPVEEIAEIASERGVILIVDGAQAAGIIPVNLVASGIDIYAFTGHKALFGPQGTGGLYIADGLEHAIKAVQSGGTGSFSEKEEQPGFLPDKFEPGTPNTPGIVLLGLGVEFICEVGADPIWQKEMLLADRFLNGLATIRGVTLYGLNHTRGRTAIISINIRDKFCSDVAAVLDDEFSIMVRPGLHCAPSAHRTIGTYPAGAVRFSPGYFNTVEDVDKALRAIDIISLR